MQFQLQISLNNAEVEEAGVWVALPAYLTSVAEKIRAGRAGGNVVDGNGNLIGTFDIVDTDAE